MIWKGEELNSPDEFVGAMKKITDWDEACAFMVAFDQNYATDPGSTRRSLGYLTGYMGRDEGKRVRAVFGGLEHPIIGDLGDDLTVYELLTLGMAFAKRELEGAGFEEAAADAREAVRMLRTLHAPETT